MTERSPFLSAGWGRYQTRGLSFANYDGSSLSREPIGARIWLGSALSGEYPIIAGIVDELIIGGDLDSVGDASGWSSKLHMQPHRTDRDGPAHEIVGGIGEKLIVEGERGPIGEADGIIGFDD